MIDWNLDEKGEFNVERVAWGDLDCALKLKGERLLNHRIGNVMWRSPEGQMGRGIGKSSEVFSFGLVVSDLHSDDGVLSNHWLQCLYTITGVETLHPDFDQLEKDGVEPEHVILYKLLSMFGPAPPELVAHIVDQYWAEMLAALSEGVQEEDPIVRFEQWDDSVFPNLDSEAKSVILRMTSLVPQKRVTMEEILEDPWWEQGDDGEQNLWADNKDNIAMDYGINNRTIQRGLAPIQTMLICLEIIEDLFWRPMHSLLPVSRSPSSVDRSTTRLWIDVSSRNMVVVLILVDGSEVVLPVAFTGVFFFASFIVSFLSTLALGNLVTHAKMAVAAFSGTLAFSMALLKLSLTVCASIGRVQVSVWWRT